jgi:hypothetical protein
MAEYDLTLSLSDCNQVLEEQRRQAASAWDVVERVCLREAQRRGDKTPVSARWLAYLTRLPDVVAFGYSAESIMCQALGGSRDAIEQAGIASALFNVFSSLFDRVCDEEPELLPELEGLVNRASIKDPESVARIRSSWSRPPLRRCDVMSAPLSSQHKRQSRRNCSGWERVSEPPDRSGGSRLHVGRSYPDESLERGHSRRSGEAWPSSSERGVLEFFV